MTSLIDISAVQATIAENDVRDLAAIALERGFIAAYIQPHFLPLLRSHVPQDNKTLVGGPVGFPDGGHSTAIKRAEAGELARAGAQELDIMMNAGRI